MSKRRTHSTVDKLPAALRDAITRMVVDGAWPDDFPLGKKDGKPRYEDVVNYCELKDHSVSKSAIGRWAKSLLTMELLRSRAEIVRNVMSDVAAERASETQKAAAEMITARVLELVCSEELTARQAKETAAAVRDCAGVAMKADAYIHAQQKAKAEAADKKITTLARKKKIDPETLKAIREQVYGIVN